MQQLWEERHHNEEHGHHAARPGREGQPMPWMPSLTPRWPSLCSSPQLFEANLYDRSVGPLLCMVGQVIHCVGTPAKGAHKLGIQPMALSPICACWPRPDCARRKSPFAHWHQGTIWVRGSPVPTSHMRESGNNGWPRPPQGQQHLHGVHKVLDWPSSRA